MRHLMLSAAAAAAALMVIPAAAQAQDTQLVVTTTVENYCSIGLANVAGSNVAVANGVRQKVTTLRMSCNAPTGARLTSTAVNGDLKSAGGVLINYDWELVVPAIPALGFAPQDTFPTNWQVVTNSGGYSEQLADGIFADLFLNLCYGVPGGPGLGGTAGDTTPGSSGCAAAPSGPGASEAPAGTYSETFKFDLDPA
ncbi:hypothetical protein Q0812_09360 [Brevundimonas sp. 2R-24]|uniref:Spore coat protein U domain-containing protein n=1 Tax=Peiella sedimenti TaxID=3061083 RepID=A0ABT8SM39_9CAUL|nr:hypothetical protein [Caulobacteraceae bacterium XZ-24]